MKRRYRVFTDYGPRDTWAVSPKKARSNVLWQLRTNGAFVASGDADSWEVREVV